VESSARRYVRRPSAPGRGSSRASSTTPCATTAPAARSGCKRPQWVVGRRYRSPTPARWSPPPRSTTCSNRSTACTSAPPPTASALGLAIVAAMRRGTVTAHPRPGGGLQVTLTMPPDPTSVA